MSFNNQLTWPAVQAFTQKKILTIQIKRKKLLDLTPSYNSVFLHLILVTRWTTRSFWNQTLLRCLQYNADKFRLMLIGALQSGAFVFLTAVHLHQEDSFLKRSFFYLRNVRFCKKSFGILLGFLNSCNFWEDIFLINIWKKLTENYFWGVSFFWMWSVLTNQE